MAGHSTLLAHLGVGLSLALFICCVLQLPMVSYLYKACDVNVWLSHAANGAWLAFGVVPPNNVWLSYAANAWLAYGVVRDPRLDAGHATHSCTTA